MNVINLFCVIRFTLAHTESTHRFYEVSPDSPTETSPATAHPTEAVTPEPSTQPTPKLATAHPTEAVTPEPSTQPTPKLTAPSSTSPCGDGICNLQQNENPQTCSTDCEKQGLTLSSSSNTDSKAAMFTVTALEAVSFSSFSFTAKKSGDSFVEVYTMIGDYAGNEKVKSAWTLCFSGVVPLVEEQLATITSLNCSTATSAGGKRSFHVVVKNGMYLQKRVSTVSNSVVRVENSVFMKKEFDKPKGDALMRGDVT